ncbi:MAG TPA: FAD-dependent oxidoreductase [Puia sp.]|nr:FAD-dependent oxidoreductase [Puia sp.]
MQQISIWEKESYFKHHDVVIVGSGLVGLWSAYHLKRKHPGLGILIVERGVIPTGASTRNAGFACFGSVTELMADTQKFGEQKMLEIVKMRFDGLEQIKKTFKKKEIDFEKFGGYELISASQKMDMNVLRSNIDFLNHKIKKIIKKRKPFRLHDSSISKFGFSGVEHIIENKFEGQLHSGKLCQALLRTVQSMGVTLLNTIEIKNFENVNGKIELHTNQPFNLSAGQLLICTNAFTKQLLPELHVEPARGQVLVTSPIPGLRCKGTFHYDEGFYYFRNLGDRILLGGARNKAFEEENTTELTTTEFIQQELESFLRQVIIPGTSYTIDHRWSGIMGMGDDKMPIVKKISENIYCAVRMGGMGVALAPVIGENIAALMTT